MNEIKINCTGCYSGKITGYDIKIDIKYHKKTPCIHIYEELEQEGGTVISSLDIGLSKSEDIYFIKQIIEDMKTTLESDNRLDIEIAKCDLMTDDYKDYIKGEISHCKLSGSLTTIDFGTGIYVVRDARLIFN